MKKNDLNTIIYVSVGIIIFIIALSIIISLLGFVFGFRYGMMGGGMMMGMMGVGSFFFLIPIVGIILIFYWIFNKDETQKKGKKESHRGNSAIRGLDRRYANGELTREQYLTMKGDILKGG